MEVESAAVAQVSPELFRQLLLSLDPLPVARQGKGGDASVPERRRGINRQQFAQMVELEDALAGVPDGVGNAHGCNNLSYRSHSTL